MKVNLNTELYTRLYCLDRELLTLRKLYKFNDKRNNGERCYELLKELRSVTSAREILLKKIEEGLIP